MVKNLKFLEWWYMAIFLKLECLYYCTIGDSSSLINTFIQNKKDRLFILKDIWIYLFCKEIKVYMIFIYIIEIMKKLNLLQTNFNHTSDPWVC